MIRRNHANISSRTLPPKTEVILSSFLSSTQSEAYKEAAATLFESIHRDVPRTCRLTASSCDNVEEEKWEENEEEEEVYVNQSSVVSDGLILPGLLNLRKICNSTFPRQLDPASQHLSTTSLGSHVLQDMLSCSSKLTLFDRCMSQWRQVESNTHDHHHALFFFGSLYMNVLCSRKSNYHLFNLIKLLGISNR